MHIVVNRKARLPVYTVRPENQNHPLRILDSYDEDGDPTQFFQDPSLRSTKFTQELEVIITSRQQPHSYVEQNFSDIEADVAPEELTETLAESDTLAERDNRPELELEPGIDKPDKENVPEQAPDQSMKETEAKAVPAKLETYWKFWMEKRITDVVNLNMWKMKSHKKQISKKKEITKVKQ